MESKAREIDDRNYALDHKCCLESEPTDSEDIPTLINVGYGVRGKFLSHRNDQTDACFFFFVAQKHQLTVTPLLLWGMWCMKS